MRERKNGNNAYFIRNDKLGDITPLSPEQGYVESKFREQRDEHGNLTYLQGEEAIKQLRGMKVINTRTNVIEDL